MKVALDYICKHSMKAYYVSMVHMLDSEASMDSLHTQWLDSLSFIWFR